MNNIAQRSGTNQNGRLSEKLLPDYFQIDERSLSDLLAFTARYSALIPFRDLKGLNQRDWNAFFTKDINVYLATILATDPERVDAEFEEYLQKTLYVFQEGEKRAAFVNSVSFVYERFKRVDVWMRQILILLKTGGRIEETVEQELRGIIQQNLSFALKRLRFIMEEGNRILDIKALTQFDFEIFLPVWDLENYVEEERYEPYKGDSVNAKINHALMELKFVFLSFFDALAYMTNRFQRFFDRALEQKNDHLPHVGLLIAFFKLKKFANKDLNDLTNKHLEFYFQHILKQEYQDPIPDQVNLCFELSANKYKHLVKEGTRVTAGYDAHGKEILFETLGDVEINKAKIHSLRSVFVSHILENQIGTYKLVTGLHAASAADTADGMGKPFENPNEDWPLFGEEQYKSGISTMGPGKLGFAISSPALFLSEGNRRVYLHLRFTKESTEIYQKLIEDIAEVKTDGNFRHAFLEVFGKEKEAAFDIQVSGPDGWIDIKKEAANEISIDAPQEWNWDGFTVSFLIPASAPSVSKYRTVGLSEEKYETDFPILKLLLAPKRTPYIYSFLQTLELSSVDIEVEVDRVKSLVILNDIGRLDPTQPFQPFGNLPAVGSYMLVGNAELFKKRVTEFQMNIEWKNFPRLGLERHYENYFPKNDPRILEEKFKVRLTALSGSEFKPRVHDKDLEYGLFTEEDGYAITKFGLNQMEKLGIRPKPELAPVTDYTNKSSIGFFKVELIEPVEAFGHDYYNERFMEISQYNADLNTTDTKKLPNPPFTPVIKEISLSYKARDYVNMMKAANGSTIEVFHIHPFGTAPIFNSRTGKVDRGLLLPQYNDDAYLYIGIKDLRPPQNLSMLFELVAGRQTHSHKLPDFKWSYLSEDRWEPLKDEHLLSDTTDKFTTTGIIRLHIPGKITKWNNLLPSGIFWLRVGVKGDPENVSRALEIRTQAIKAVWVQNDNVQRLREPLPPYSIRALYRPVPEVRAIEQPYPSFHGQPAETQVEFFSRVSERLRHKGRAVTHWDYERLALERFHTLFQAKASSHITNPEHVEPGHVRLAVVPRINHGTNELNPKVNHNTLLNITNYIRENTSPFVKLRVSNPVYEYVRVVASVKFVDGKNNGHSLEQLREDIQYFMCPWLYDKGEELDLGGNLQVEALYNYIQNLDYVKFVTRFALLHFYLEDEESGIYRYLHTANQRLDRDQRETLRATLPWSVLVPDGDHELEIIQKEREIRPEFKSHPVDFQGKFQVSPQKHIRRVYRESSSDAYINTGYKVNDTFIINVPDSVSSSS